MLVEQSETSMQRIKLILSSKVFLFLSLSIAGLYFIVTGIQYWVSDFIQEVLLVPPEETYYYFSITCLSAPLLGIVSGGAFFSSLGGYNNPRSFLWCLIIGSSALLFAAPVAFSDIKWLTYVCIWLLLFVGASILPTLTGIMLNAVAETRRTTANAIATMIYNLMGYLPAPFIYGAVAEVGVDTVDANYWSRVAMGVLMSWTIMTAVFIVAAYAIWKKELDQKT